MDFTILESVQCIRTDRLLPLKMVPLCGRSFLFLWSNQAPEGFPMTLSSLLPVSLLHSSCTSGWASCCTKHKYLSCVCRELCCSRMHPPHTLFLPVWFMFTLFPVLPPPSILSSCWAQHLSDFGEEPFASERHICAIISLCLLPFYRPSWAFYFSTSTWEVSGF